MRTIHQPDLPGRGSRGGEVESVKADSERLIQLIRAMGRRRSLRDPLSSGMEKSDLTPSQLHVLLWLDSDGALPMKEIAHRLGVTEKTVTGVIDRLEKLGHVARERSEEDRRVVLVHLTRSGATLSKKLDCRMHDGIHRMMALIDRADRAELLRIIEKLFERVVAQPAPEVAEPPKMRNKSP